MPPGIELKTPRLLLRRWRPEDREPFAAMNADPAVMEHFPAPLSREESDAAVERIEEQFAARGYGFWAVEVPGAATFIGFIGLGVPGFQAPFTPCVEIGWRLGRAWWGQGLATEGAQAAMKYGFERLRLPEIVSFTVPGNYCPGQRAVPARNGEARNALFRGLRASAHRLTTSSAPPRPLPSLPERMGG